MKKITEAEVKLFLQQRIKRKTQSPNAGCVKLIDELLVNEGLVIKPEDWHTKTPPNSYVNQLFRKTRSLKVFSVYMNLNEEGWIVIRKK